MITCKGRTELLKMERATKIVQETLAECVAACRPGVTTEEIDRIAADGIRSRGGKAAFPGYRGYPKTICSSVNEEVVHGIPTPKRKLRDGDIVGLDLGAIVDGYFGDAARTAIVGDAPPAVCGLVKDTWRALVAGVSAVRVGDGSATSGPPSRRSPRRKATASSASTSVTASGPLSTRSRRFRTTVPGGRARSSAKG